MKKINNVLNVFLCIGILTVLGVCLWKYNPEIKSFTKKVTTKIDNAKNEKKEKKQEVEIDPSEEELVLRLKCAGVFLVGETQNTIEREKLPSLEVYTPYDITNYKVMGQEGLITEGTYEKKSDTKLNSFLIEGATEEVTEIRLIGFDKKMKKLADQYYYIIFN